MQCEKTISLRTTCATLISSRHSSINNIQDSQLYETELMYRPLHGNTVFRNATTHCK